MYLEDIKPPQLYRSREYPLTEKEIIDYARQWDAQPSHTDPEFARNNQFGCVIAAGVHLLSICMKLSLERKPQTAWIAGLAWDELRFVNPARPGDTLILELELISKRESKSNPNVGIVRGLHRLVNQRNETVLSFVGTGLIKKRNKTPSAPL